MRRFLAAAALATALSLVSQGARGAEIPEEVSLVRLIADPQRYDGKLVFVEGHFDGGHFEQCRIFLSREDTEYYVRANSVGVSWPGCRTMHPERLPMRWRYVTVTGVFRVDPEFNYAYIDDVRSIEPKMSQRDFQHKYWGPFWIRYWPWFPWSLALIPIVTFAAYRLGLRSSKR